MRQVVRHITKVTLVGILAAALIVSGCSTAWIQTAINDAPIVLQIVVSILSIADVAAVPVAQSAGAQAKSDLALLQQYLADYKAAQANSTEQVTALRNIQAGLTAATNDINAILAAVHIADPKKQQAIEGGLNVALTVIMAIESLIPAPVPGPVAARQRVSGAPALLKPSEVKRTFNVIVGPQYPLAELK